MKRSLSFIIVLLILQVGYCQKQKKVLCQKWKISLEHVMNDLPEAMKAMLDLLPTADKEAFENQMKELEKLHYQFNKDGTMEVKTLENGLETGRWEFSNEDQTQLKITKDSDEELLTWNLVDLSMDLMKVQDPKKEMIMTFIPSTD